jgi:dolichyl-phosphate beta-glucosyltransferase
LSDHTVVRGDQGAATSDMRFQPGSEGSPARPALSVVVPAYNEEARLGASLKRMVAYFDTQPYTVEILVVDDGSDDATVGVVQQIAACRPQVRILSYPVNSGKGHAVRYGVLRATGDRILFCDADLATPIEEVERLLAKLDAGYDIAIGSRDVAGSELLKRQSLLREFGGRCFNKLVQLIAVPGIHDTQCGFKLFSHNAATVVFEQCRIDHFAFDVEVLYLSGAAYPRPACGRGTCTVGASGGLEGSIRA